MITKQMIFVFLYVLTMLFYITGGAEIIPPVSHVDCTSAFAGMADCWEFIESGSTVEKPKKSCCFGLQQLVVENTACLCQVFDFSKKMEITPDINKTLSLPVICHVQTSPINECNTSLHVAQVKHPPPFSSSLSDAPVQAPSISPSSLPSVHARSADCRSTLMSMTDCMPFIESGSEIDKPDKSCCRGLRRVVKENIICLCQAHLRKEMGITLDVNKTLFLPYVCHVKTPRFIQCNVSGTPPRVSNISPSSFFGAPTAIPPMENGSAEDDSLDDYSFEDESVENRGQRIISPSSLITGFAATLLSYNYLSN